MVPEKSGKEKTAKAALRQKMLALRLGQGRALAARRSGRAQALLVEQTLWQKAVSPALYAALPGETDTAELLARALDEGRNLLLPRITDLRGGRMELAICHSLAELEPGPMGILQPPGGGPAPLPDLLLVPGLAFDRAGHRLGFGGGFYDRFLAAGRNCPAVGFCFAFQILDHIPFNALDMPVDAICSEEGFLWL